MPLAVIDLSLYVISVLTPITIVQLLNLRDFGAQTSNFFAKHCQMIHTNSIAFRRTKWLPIHFTENSEGIPGIQRFSIDGGFSQEQTLPRSSEIQIPKANSLTSPRIRLARDSALRYLAAAPTQF